MVDIQRSQIGIGSEYNPRASALVEQAWQRWSRREDRKEHLVKYGIPELDLALSGIDVENGELNLIQGFHKHRKTTFMINVLCNIMTDPKTKGNVGMVIDTLESGMQQARYIDQIMCVLATRYLFEQGHTHDEYCLKCSRPDCRDIGLTPEYLSLIEPTQNQTEALRWAEQVIRENRLYLFGANPQEGNSRNLDISLKRLEYLVSNGEVKIVVVDHVQQYDMGESSQYEKLERSIEGYGNLVARHKFVSFILSQVSLTSWRGAKQGIDSTTATGGNRGAQEAVSTLETRYESGSNKMSIIIKESRKAESQTIEVPIEKQSGCFIRRKM